jgi:hypothetical protein
LARKGECYFYGSKHNKIPDDSIKDLISKADYVLLEGFDTRNKWLALKKQPCAIVIIGGILLYFSIVRLIRLIRRSPNDMKYVESIAIKMGKKTEYVDSSLTEVFLSNSLFVKAFSYGSCMVEIFMLLFMVGIPVIGILAKGPSSLSHFLSKLVILVILYMLFTIFWLLFTSKLFVSEINRSFRDPKVIERARELIERGYNVLIVRGCNHEDFIIEGLQKYSINCKVIHECPRILDLFRDLLYGIVVALARISRPLNKKPLQTKRHRRASKAHEPLDR